MRRLPDTGHRFAEVGDIATVLANVDVADLVVGIDGEASVRLPSGSPRVAILDAILSHVPHARQYLWLEDGVQTNLSQSPLCIRQPLFVSIADDVRRYGHAKLILQKAFDDLRLNRVDDNVEGGIFILGFLRFLDNLSYLELLCRYN